MKASKTGNPLPDFFRKPGPGLVADAADDDPAGAQHVTNKRWHTDPAQP